MYRSDTVLNRKTANKEFLEASLRDSIKISQINNISNHSRKNTAKKNVVHQSKEIVNQKQCKGKLIKSSMRSIKMDIENKTKPEPKPKPKPNPRVAQRRSTLEVLDKLREIEKVMNKDDLLDQTNEEIDIASRQLEEIQKLLTSKLRKVAISEINQNRKKKVEDSPRNQRFPHSFTDKVSKQFERMKTEYLTKAKIHYKSVKDVENLINSRDISAYTELETSKPDATESFSDNDNVRTVWTRNKVTRSKQHLPEKDVKNSHAQTQTKLRNSRENSHFTQKVNIMHRQHPGNISATSSESTVNRNNLKIVAGKEPPRYTSRIINRKRMKALLADIPESESSSEDPRNENSSESELEYSDEINLNKHIFVNTKIKEKKTTEDFLQEDSDMKFKSTGAESEVPCKDSSAAPESVEESILNEIWPDAVLKESVLKSEYLSKEFSIDFENKFPKADKAVEKRSMQLLETTRRKFQDHQTCQLANLKRRDQKLYTTLNIALKDTIFGEIQP